MLNPQSWDGCMSATMYQVLERCIPVQQPGDPAMVPHGSLQAHCLLTRNLLFDLELLAHTDYFVGTTKSALSPLIEVCSLGCS